MLYSLRALYVFHLNYEYHIDRSIAIARWEKPLLLELADQASNITWQAIILWNAQPHLQHVGIIPIVRIQLVEDVLNALGA